jgi:hypothetical protein
LSGQLIERAVPAQSSAAKQKRNISPSRKNHRVIKTPTAGKLGEVVARIEPLNFSTRRENHLRGRPPKAPGFDIRTAQGGFGVWLSQSGKKLEYCCFLAPSDFIRVANLPFPEFIQWVLVKMANRETDAGNEAKVSRLLETVRGLLAVHNLGEAVNE